MQGRNDVPTDSGKARDEREYADLLTLEEMESLLEELEDADITGAIRAEELPGDLAELARSLNVTSTDELRTRIRTLHATLDGEELE